MSGIDEGDPPVSGEPQSDVLDEGADLLHQAFPDIRCLRCGNDNFRLIDSPAYTGRLQRRDVRIGGVQFNPFPQTVALICERCGLVDQYALDYLRKANKPIETQ
jgi:predicted nucleic-acid-binding Zn-ribbon protein